MRRFLAVMLAVVLCMSMNTQVFAATVNDDEDISTCGISTGGSQSGWSGEFTVNLSSGGDNGSVVFRITGDSSTEVYFWVKNPSGNKVTEYKYESSTPLYPNGGEEQTIYFKSGCSAPAGTYTIGWTAYGTSSTTVKAWICSW